MTILQKGILLIAVPLILEVLLSLVLFVQNQELEMEKERLNRSRAILSSIYAVSDTFLEAGGALVQLENSRDFKALMVFLGAMERIPGAKDVVLKTAGSELEGKELNELLEVYESAYRRFSEVRDLVVNPNASPEEIRSRALKTLHLSASFVESMSSYRNRAERTFEDAENRQMQMRTHMRNLIIAGTAGNIVISSGLAIWLGLTTLRRLKIVMDNARRIGAQIPLNPPLRGKDELAFLDALVHQASDGLEEARKMEKQAEQFRDQLHAMVVHDLRSPLTSVNAAVCMVHDGLAGEVPERATEMLSMAQRNLSRIQVLVNDFLQLKKLESGRLELELTSLPLGRLLSSAVEMVQEQASLKGLTLDIPEEDVVVEVDGPRIEQVLTNILTNAIRHSPEGGKITLRLSGASDMVRVEVHDQGPGVSEQWREKIFQSYIQVTKEDTRSGGGTGLGLPICKMLIEKHGGKIGVEPSPSGGSIFWFTVRRAPSERPLIELT